MYFKKIFTSLWLVLVFLLHPNIGKSIQVEGDFDLIQKTSQSYINLVNAVSKAVVQLKVEGFGGPGQSQTDINSIMSRSLKSGSGVIVDSSGYIITNTHVVGNAKSVQVILPNREPYDPQEESILKQQGQIIDAEIVGMDRETDIAVLKIDAGKQPYLNFGNSDKLRSGQMVFAIGSPLGLKNSVSMGIVSSTARQLREEDPMIYIQTDAPINPGNSGGPLINDNAEIVGINTLNLSESGGSEGLGFAAPSNIVEDIYKQIKKYGRVKRGVIGIYAQTIEDRLSQGLNIAGGYRVIISDVFPGSPADRVGLQAGDVVKSLDGKFMENARQLNVNIYGKPIGSYINLTIIRDGKEVSKDVKVVERNDDDTRFMDYVNPEENFVERLGILAVELNTEIRELLPPLRKRGGILIAGSNGKARVLGDPIQPGDIIYKANNRPVNSLEELKNMINSLAPGEVIAFHAERNGKLIYLSYRMN